MTASCLPAVEIEPPGSTDAAVIWLHGLGADGHDFEPLVPELGLPREHGIRFVFPHAPGRAVTINGGIVMPAWYDIRALDLSEEQDAAGVRSSAAELAKLIDREQTRGIVASRIVVAGFSQGGAVALHAALRYGERLAGVLALSTYLPLDDTVPAEASAANADLPVFMGHGLYDPIVPIAYGERSSRLLAAWGHPVQWHRYAVEHGVDRDEIRDIGAWLLAVLAPHP